MYVNVFTAMYNMFVIPNIKPLYFAASKTKTTFKFDCEIVLTYSTKNSCNYLIKQDCRFTVANIAVIRFNLNSICVKK